MSNSLSLELIESYRQKILNNDKSKLSMNSAIHNDIVKLAMNWEEFRKIDHTFSDVITDEMKATNQKSSGRCWGFAGLNLFRIYLARKHNLKDFQFSQNSRKSMTQLLITLSLSIFCHTHTILSILTR